MTTTIDTRSTHDPLSRSTRWRTKLFGKGRGVTEREGKLDVAAQLVPETSEEVDTKDLASPNEPDSAAPGPATLEEHTLQPQPSTSKGKTVLRSASPAGSISKESEPSVPVTRRSSLAPMTPNVDRIERQGEAQHDTDTTITKRIAFYQRDQEYFWLSNASPHPIHLDGIRYPTAEHLFQSLKFLPHRIDLATKVRKATSPSDAIREARRHAQHVSPAWIGQRENVMAMRTVLLLKFSQHSALRRQLLATGDAELVEDSPTDAFWGIASAHGAGAGRNELGKALARTRETLRDQAGLGYGSAAKTV